MISMLHHGMHLIETLLLFGDHLITLILISTLDLLLEIHLPLLILSIVKENGYNYKFLILQLFDLTPYEQLYLISHIHGYSRLPLTEIHGPPLIHKMDSLRTTGLILPSPTLSHFTSKTQTLSHSSDLLYYKLVAWLYILENLPSSIILLINLTYKEAHIYAVLQILLMAVSSYLVSPLSLIMSSWLEVSLLLIFM